MGFDCTRIAAPLWSVPVASACSMMIVVCVSTWPNDGALLCTAVLKYLYVCTQVLVCVYSSTCMCVLKYLYVCTEHGCIAMTVPRRPKREPLTRCFTTRYGINDSAEEFTHTTVLSVLQYYSSNSIHQQRRIATTLPTCINSQSHQLLVVF
jgi:hypothetical protein